jgi:hypothetical protein
MGISVLEELRASIFTVEERSMVLIFALSFNDFVLAA